MSAFIQPDGSVNPIFCTYLVLNNEGQLLTRAESMSPCKKRNSFPCVSLLTGAMSTLLQTCLCMGVRAVVTVAPHCIAGQDR